MGSLDNGTNTVLFALSGDAFASNRAGGPLGPLGSHTVSGACLGVACLLLLHFDEATGLATHVVGAGNGTTPVRKASAACLVTVLVQVTLVAPVRSGHVPG